MAHISELHLQSWNLRCCLQSPKGWFSLVSILLSAWTWLDVVSVTPEYFYSKYAGMLTFKFNFRKEK